MPGGMLGAILKGKDKMETKNELPDDFPDGSEEELQKIVDQVFEEGAHLIDPAEIFPELRK